MNRIIDQNFDLPRTCSFVQKIFRICSEYIYLLTFTNFKSFAPYVII